MVEEAGGVVTNSSGKPFDFGLGRTLGDNDGILGTSRAMHSRVLEVIRKVKEEEARSVTSQL